MRDRYKIVETVIAALLLVTGAAVLYTVIDAFLRWVRCP